MLRRRRFPGAATAICRPNCSPATKRNLRIWDRASRRSRRKFCGAARSHSAIAPAEYRPPVLRESTADAHESFTRRRRSKSAAIGHWRNLTAVNAGLSLPARVQSVWWKNDGFDIQGWLLLPLHADGKMPMITQVHGGPAAAVTPGFPGPGIATALLEHGLRHVSAEPARQLWSGRALYSGECARFRPRRLARHFGRHRRRREGRAHRYGSAWA